MTEPVETAQALYAEMMKSVVAPFLRSHGFKRKGQQFSRTTNGYLEGVDLQKSRWNTKDEVSFTVNLAVYHPVAQEEQISAWQAAMGRWGRDIRVVPTVGNLGDRLGHLTPEAIDKWWTFHDRGEMEKAARSVIADLADYGLPRMAQETAKPLVSPSYIVESRKLVGERHFDENGALVGGVMATEQLWPPPEGTSDSDGRAMATPLHTWPAIPVPTAPERPKPSTIENPSITSYNAAFDGSSRHALNDEGSHTLCGLSVESMRKLSAFFVLGRRDNCPNCEQAASSPDR